MGLTTLSILDNADNFPPLTCARSPVNACSSPHGAYRENIPMPFSQRLGLRIIHHQAVGHAPCTPGSVEVMRGEEGDKTLKDATWTFTHSSSHNPLRSRTCTR